MAKQKGLHQIKGKVGDMSYYQTAGVPGGLIRRIPEGLSSRVKTADEYANTRLNNDEFKNASGIATFAFNAVPSRKRSMMRRFAVAQMIKEALMYIKDGTGNWGQRIPSATFDNILVDLLENHSKNGPYAGDFGDLVTAVSTNTRSVSLRINQSTIDSLLSKGFDGFYVVSVRGALAEVVQDGFVRQIFGVTPPSPDDIQLASLTPGDEEIDSFEPAPAALALSPQGYTAAQGAANNGIYSIVSFLPYVQVGSARHVLNEYATFAAVAHGAIPTT